MTLKHVISFDLMTCAIAPRRLARERMIAQYSPHVLADSIATELTRVQRSLIVNQA